MRVGLVVVTPEASGDERAWRQAIDEGARSTPEGRMLVLLLPSTSVWEPSLPLEAIATEAVLGQPSARGDTDDFAFFGTVAVRFCAPSTDAWRRTERESTLLLFRRSGPKAYARAKSAESEILDAARIWTLHPVFTRDVANNVWHMPADRGEDAILGRLAALLAWPDEDVLQVDEAGSRSWTGVRGDLDADLIGVPQRIAYDWHPSQTVLPVGE